jgi:diguanylate cyclase (GGDEF)-like protein
LATGSPIAAGIIKFMEETTKILLIEDDQGDADYLREILFEKGDNLFKVECVPRLHEALAKISERPYDIILADLSLPDSRGLDTFTKVQQNSGKLPVLILTGLNDDESALNAMRQGAQDYLVKGQFTGDFLRKSIRYAIERNKVRQELEDATKVLSESNQQLDRLAHKDALTDLLNRRGLDQVLSREIAWAHRHGSSMMALIIDLDDFKKINDNMGHSTGDGVLRELAARIQQPLRSTDFTARVGGDEFLILLPDTDAAEGIKIAEKVREAISEKPFVISSQSINVTISVGVVSLTGATTTIDDLLSETHQALYQSKRQGKNRVSFDGKGTQEGTEIATIIEELQNKDRFHAVMQPIVDVKKNEVVAYEFLSRSSVPSFEKPEDFFRISTENNSLTAIDRQCLSTCIDASKKIATQFRRHINLSPSTIAEVSTPDLIEAFPPPTKGEKYCIEINQHQIVGDPSYLVKSLQAFKKAGFLIVIENVSFGQNSLESIILLEPDVLKIDKQYVIGLGQDRARLRSLNRLLKMAESLRMEVVAHGIESAEDLEGVKSVGIKFGQGFLWGQPTLVGGK